MSKSRLFNFQQAAHPKELYPNYMHAKHFGEDMHDFFHSRMDRARPDRLSNEHSKDIAEYCRLYEEIKSMLPAHGQKLLFDLDAIAGKIEADQQDMMYQSGFTDGIRFVVQSLSGTIN